MFLGTAKDITLGPTAIMSLLTAQFGVTPVANNPTYAILLSLIGGIIQTFMGILHIGMSSFLYDHCLRSITIDYYIYFFAFVFLNLVLPF